MIVQIPCDSFTLFAGPADYDICNENNGPSHSFGMKLPEPVSVLQSKWFFSSKLYVCKPL